MLVQYRDWKTHEDNSERISGYFKYISLEDWKSCLVISLEAEILTNLAWPFTDPPFIHRTRCLKHCDLTTLVRELRTSGNFLSQRYSQRGDVMRKKTRGPPQQETFTPLLASSTHPGEAVWPRGSEQGKTSPASAVRKRCSSVTSRACHEDRNQRWWRIRLSRQFYCLQEPLATLCRECPHSHRNITSH